MLVGFAFGWLIGVFSAVIVIGLYIGFKDPEF